MDNIKDEKTPKPSNTILDEEKPLEDHQNSEFIEDEDFDLDNEYALDDNFSNQQDYSTKPQTKTSVNVFNVVVFGGLAVAILGAGFVFIPKMLAPEPPQVAQTSAPIQPQTDMTVQTDTEVNKEIAEAAVTNNLSNEVSQSGGLLANPDVLDEQPTEEMASAPSGDENFEALNSPEFTTQQETSSESYAEDMDALFNEAAPSDNAPVVMIDEPDAMDNMATSPLPSPADAEETTMPMENADNDISYEQLEAVAEPVQETVPTVMTDAQQQPATPADAEVAQRLNELSENVQTLAGEIGRTVNTMNTRISSLETQMSAPANDADISSLQKTIEQLEKRIDAMAKAQSNASVAKPEIKVEPATKAPATTTRPQSDAAYKPVPKETARPAVAPQVATNWTLRGASIGEAYLADKNSSDVRTVKIGDTLNGLGRIHSIAVENGKWVVRGTNGSVSQ